MTADSTETAVKPKYTPEKLARIEELRNPWAKTKTKVAPALDESPEHPDPSAHKVRGKAKH